MDRPQDVADAGWFGREVRIARRVSGLSQEQVARRCGMSQVSESRIERGVLIPDIQTAKRLAAVLGYRLVLRLVPGPGLRLRDTGQMEIAQKIRHEAHPNWRIQLQVPVGNPPDRRAADVVLDLGSEVTIIEIERWLVDFQAQLRRSVETAVARGETGPASSPHSRCARPTPRAQDDRPTCRARGSAPSGH
jgi:transcriptional regulator with XRE-family HTH domain